ncbi:yjeF C-terminal region, hydroxyethylthiazole kinase-related/yjeF N-terminal region [Rhodovulum sp. ES.010]|uniref:bifunctional ADP-dependent NAD(P)H-hydrate dehydratase/NAD(P)H-hydrate epimerase n=1 Tax=Rhodovulum sp. ES.010 TaxID=1882821 RepID=UPI00092AC1B7|nr:bifunctional ADP-dependent NAD(P)H-hydrate dehydratase/NAD(P)H-hydrate epimerase [Rhodovulum sp. ES.010]SIO24851.1 yjeF C-terminal region, hydroxyethylthiazole kinase-related/yjeF N-terminal region [Rhodovulum sp. ES.010]
MTELVTSAQMRAIEEAAIASGAVTGLELMERAGRGAVETVLAEWPELSRGAHRAVVLCGPGNNGGDGFVVARCLRDKGWAVELWLLGDAAKLPPDARANHDRWARMGAVRALDTDAPDGSAPPDLLVDALFGTGLSRPIPEVALRALLALRGRDAPQCRGVAVDCPSGLNCDTGEMLLPALPGGRGAPPPAGQVAADLTVTFHRAKVGHYLGPPPMPSGKVVVVDIGLEPHDRPSVPPDAPPDPARVRRVSRAEGRHGSWPGSLFTAGGPAAHKYARGHAVVLAGGVGCGGAGRLAARGALRVGAGLVTVACPPAALIENAAQLTAIMLRPLAGPEALAEMLADDRLTALCLGPGLGVGAATRALVATAVDAVTGRTDAERRRVVLDADALTSFAGDAEALFALTHRTCVMTPHEGEFARLFPDLSHAARRRVGMSKVDAARRAADRAGCTVLLKGPDTVIASPGGVASIHAALYDRSVPWLGTAGAGDVLSGMIAGLLAAPGASGEIHGRVEAAAWLHVEAARVFGPGLIAEDLPEMLPRVFFALGL